MNPKWGEKRIIYKEDKMKKNIKRLSSVVAIMSILALPGLADRSDRKSSHEYDVVVKVDFSNPSGFRDINFDGMDTDKGHQFVLNEIRDVYRTEAQKHLPKDYTLDVRVQDIDLAGEYEPERLPENNVRIDKDIYPPRIEFEYQVLDDEQTLVFEGRETLTDLNYLNNPVRALRRGGKVSYDVATLIRDWMKGPMSRKMREDNT